jgi:hypothetical protein
MTERPFGAPPPYVHERLTTSVNGVPFHVTEIPVE